jgi:hypothetical protein
MFNLIFGGIKSMTPSQAKTKLKSIEYWQKVVNGDLPAEKPLAYYENKLKGWTTEKIQQLEEKADS